jgi:hypothetical protein
LIFCLSTFKSTWNYSLLPDLIINHIQSNILHSNWLITQITNCSNSPPDGIRLKKYRKVFCTDLSSNGFYHIFWHLQCTDFWKHVLGHNASPTSTGTAAARQVLCHNCYLSADGCGDRWLTGNCLQPAEPSVRLFYPWFKWYAYIQLQKEM